MICSVALGYSVDSNNYFEQPSSLLSRVMKGIARSGATHRTAHGGGIAVWLKNGLAHQQLAQSSTGSHEVIWLSFRLHCGRKVVVCAAYRPGSSADDDISLLEHIDTMIPRLRPHGTQIIIAGDLNVHNRAWICSNRTTTAGEFAEDVCLGHGLQQHVVVPTRGSNTLDLVMSDFAHTPAMHYFPP